MDYKEQIEKLRFLSSHVPEQMCDADGKDPLEKAADAIETLLAERDAAIEMLHGECHACKHNAGWHNIGKCGVCVHETARDSFTPGKRTDCWEWCSPQKGDKEN